MQPYKKTIQILKVFVCGGGVLNKHTEHHKNKNGSRCNLFIKHHATSHNKRTPPGTRNKGSYNCLPIDAARRKETAKKRRKVAAISTLLYKVRNKHT